MKRRHSHIRHTNRQNEVCYAHNFYKIVKVDEDEFEKVIGDADTLAGMLLEIKGEFPALHEKVTYHNYEFEVLEMDSRRILKVKFTILPKEPEVSEGKE